MDSFGYPVIIFTSPLAMRLVFAATPIIALQLIGAAYFQAIGKAVPALLLTLTRQGFFFIPLLLLLPNFWGELGVWLSFPIAAMVVAAACCDGCRRRLLRWLSPPIAAMVVVSDCCDGCRRRLL